MNDEIKEIKHTLQLLHAECNPKAREEDINWVLDYITNLQQENERIEKEYKDKVTEIGKLLSRIYKAVEYVDKETGKGIYESGYGRGTAVTICKEHLLNILQNGSEDNDE